MFALDSDKRAICQVLAGKRDAFSALVQNYHAAAMAVAMSYTSNPADAEDATQEAFLRAFQALDKLEEKAKFRQWFLAIVRHVSIDLVRKRERQHGLLRDEGIQPQAQEPDYDADEVRNFVRSKVYDLPVDQREVLLLHYFAGKSTAEIADSLDLSREAVKKRLQRARANLSAQLVGSFSDLFSQDSGGHNRVNRIMGGILALPLTTWEHKLTVGGATGISSLSSYFGAFTAVKAISIALIAILGSLLAMISLSFPGQFRLDLPSQNAVDSRATNNPDFSFDRISQNDSMVIDSATGPIDGVVILVDGSSDLTSNDSASGVRLERFTWEKHEMAPAKTETHYAPFDEDGIARFGKIRKGTYLIVAKTSGRTAVDAAHIEDPTKTITRKLTWKPKGHFEGRVQDSFGNPISNAVVYPYWDVREDREIWSGYAIALRGLTNDLGAFRLENIPKNAWSFIVKAPGYASMVTKEFTPGMIDEPIVLGRGGGVRGRVIDLVSREPLPNVSLTIPGLLRHDRFFPVTNLDGEFRVSALAPGVYGIHLIDSVYAGEPVTIIAEVETGETKDIGNFTAVHGPYVSGTVYDAATGEPVDGATISIENRAAGPVVTDGNGRYSALGIGLGTRRIAVASAPGYETTSHVPPKVINFQVGTAITDADFAITEGQEFSGIVIGSHGPAVGAAIHALSEGSQQIGESTSDKAGRFSLRAMPQEERVLVWATLDEQRSRLRSVKLHEGYEPEELRLELEDPSTLSGRLRQESGRMSGAWNLTLHDTQAPDAMALTTRSSPDGTFRFEGLWAGNFLLKAMPAGLNEYTGFQERQISIGPGETRKNVTIEVDTGLSIAGNVYGVSGPALGAIVRCVGPVQAETTTNDEGKFLLSGLMPGFYNIYVSHSVCCSNQVSDIPAGSSDLTIQIAPKGLVEGVVLSAVTGEPIEDYAIAHYPGEASQRWEADMPPFAMIRDKNGRFLINGVDSGTTTLVVRAPGHAETLTTIRDMEPMAVRENTVILAEPGYGAEGVVVDPNGIPIPDASLYFDSVPPGARSQTMAVMKTGAKGRFRLSTVPGEGAILWAISPDGRVGWSRVKPGYGADVSTSITVRSGFEVSGSLHIDGVPVANGLIEATMQYPDNHSRFRCNTDADGCFTLTGLPTGRYRIGAAPQVFAAASSRRLFREVAIEAADISDLNFDGEGATAVLEATFETGSPTVTGIFAELRRVRAGQEEIVPCEAASSGTIRSMPASPGRYEFVIEVRNDGGTRRTKTIIVDLAAGMATELAVVLP